jgi:multiple sugar transport system permease protein
MCFVFTGWYNNLLWPLVLTAGQESQTVPVVIASIGGRTVVKWTLQMAASLIASVPSMIIYLIGARYIVRGVLASVVMKA